MATLSPEEAARLQELLAKSSTTQGEKQEIDNLQLKQKQKQQ
jgi:hypothetical protein